MVPDKINQSHRYNSRFWDGILNGYQLILCGSGVQTRPAGQPQIYLMVQCRGLHAFIGAPSLDERSVLLSTFGKKIQRISGEDPFFWSSATFGKI